MRGEGLPDVCFAEMQCTLHTGFPSVIGKINSCFFKLENPPRDIAMGPSPHNA